MQFLKQFVRRFSLRQDGRDKTIILGLRQRDEDNLCSHWLGNDVKDMDDLLYLNKALIVTLYQQ